MESTNPHDDIWTRIKDIRFAMLTTREPDGTLTSRPMTTVQKDFDGSLWFFTSASSPPAMAIAQQDAVGVAYCEPKDDRYVSLSGQATLQRNRSRMEALWSPMVKAWFPKGLDDPDLTLLRVEVHRAEYWDVKESKPVQLYKMAKAVVSGERPTDMGEHRTVTL